MTVKSWIIAAVFVFLVLGAILTKMDKDQVDQACRIHYGDRATPELCADFGE